MIAQVRRLLNDTAQRSYSDTVIEEYLHTAAETFLWPDLAEHPTGRRLLLKRSSADAATAELAIPEDCIQIEKIQISGATNIWETIPRHDQEPARTPAFVHGSASIFNPSANTVPFISWNDDAASPGMINLTGNLSGRQVRFVYVYRPMFPICVTQDDVTTFGSFYDPDPEDESIIQPLPPSVATAVEHMAASLIALEELEDGKPVGPHRSMYVSILNNLCAVGSPTGSRTHTIRLVR